MTALVPGLTIEAEGVGNAKGQLVANKITFDPDAFAIEVAEEQQIMANKAARWFLSEKKPRSPVAISGARPKQA